MNKTATVHLGGRVFPVVPQKHARLRHYLTAEDFQALFSSDYSAVGYRLLSVVIPSILGQPNANPPVAPYAEWEFDGFTSEEKWNAYKNGDRSAYDESNDPSPTTDEIVEALETALKVNGAGRLGKLVSLLQTAGNLQAATPETLTPPSPVSPGANGESPSPSIGTSPPTSTMN